MANVFNGIQNLSIGSLYIEMYIDDIKLGKGTAFVAKSKKGYYLITNRHNVTGVSQYDGCFIFKGLPNKIKIYHNTYSKKDAPAKWMPVMQNLYDEDNKKLWVEHPIWKEQVDFVALKINDAEDLSFLLIKFSEKSDVEQIKLAPSDRVSVIGYPFGISAGINKEQYLAIWSSGYIASEPMINYEGLPKFLIDCRTRPGQSGSPVYSTLYTGQYDLNSDENEYNRKMKIFDRADFLGIYSGRIHKDSDIGIVWKSSAILELIEHIDENEDIL